MGIEGPRQAVLPWTSPAMTSLAGKIGLTVGSNSLICVTNAPVNPALVDHWPCAWTLDDVEALVKE